MADVVDIANNYVQSGIDEYTAKRASEAEEKNNEFQVGSFYCIECDDVIHHARRAAIKGVKTCVDCQNLKERGLKW